MKGFSLCHPNWCLVCLRSPLGTSWSSSAVTTRTCRVSSSRVTAVTLSPGARTAWCWSGTSAGRTRARIFTERLRGPRGNCWGVPCAGLRQASDVLRGLRSCPQCPAGRPIQDPRPKACLVPPHTPDHRPALRFWGPHGPGGHRLAGSDHEGSVPSLDPWIPGSHWLSTRRGADWPPPCAGCLSSRQPIIPVPDQGHPEMDGLACLLEIPTRPRCSGRLPLTV